MIRATRQRQSVRAFETSFIAHFKAATSDMTQAVYSGGYCWMRPKGTSFTKLWFGLGSPNRTVNRALAPTEANP